MTAAGLAGAAQDPGDAGARAGAGGAQRAAAVAFLWSRALVVATSAVVLALGPGAGGAGRWAELLLRGDGAWYVGTASAGYDPGPFSLAQQHNWAFFPLLPLLLRAASRVTGELVFTGAVLSNALLLVGLALLHRLATAAGLRREAADRAVLYTALWPTAVFFSAPTTEALFLALGAGCLLAGVQRRLAIAGLLGALASAARPNGVVLLVPLFLLWRAWPDRRPRQLWALALVPLGTVAFMAHLWAVTGNPLAFSAIQARWARHPGFFLGPLWQYLRHPLPVAVEWNFRLLNFLGGVAGLWAAAWWARRRSWPLAAYALVGMLLPLSTHTLQSLARFAMVLVPVPLALAAAAAPRWHRAVVAALAAALVAMTALFAAGYTWAVT